MAYKVKEIFYTLQGEGANAGKPSVFCRFTGCNLWSGKEEDRSTAQCRFCDTDFVGGRKYETPSDVTLAIGKHWPESLFFSGTQCFVVFTGGEPMLQLDDRLIRDLHGFNMRIAVETNGTIAVPRDIDWITVSPKANTKIVQKCGDELKIVYPQDGMDPKRWEKSDFKHFFISPKWSIDKDTSKKSLEDAIKFCLENPRWRLSVQTHKYIGMP